ncbi:hypothetical protein [Duganella rhizosphaerae]|uniref:hypothetical protein n=1 Tax=Duganella rhizosphaerae TaxID=2885763 RepID=UPI00403F4BE7
MRKLVATMVLGAILTSNAILGTSTAMAADQPEYKAPTRARSSIIFDSSGNAVFTSNNVIIGSAVNFRPAKDLQPITPAQVLTDESPDDPVGPPKPDPDAPKPPKVPDLNQPQPKPKPKTNCDMTPGCIPLGKNARLIRYGRDFRDINVYKLESGVLSKEVMGAAGRTLQAVEAKHQ